MGDKGSVAEMHATYPPPTHHEKLKADGSAMKPKLTSQTATIMARPLSRTARPMAGKTSPSAECVATVGEGGAGQRDADISVSHTVSQFVASDEFGL